MSNEFYVECYLDESSGPTKLADLACERTEDAVRALAGNLAGMYRPGDADRIRLRLRGANRADVVDVAAALRNVADAAVRKAWAVAGAKAVSGGQVREFNEEDRAPASWVSGVEGATVGTGVWQDASWGNNAAPSWELLDGDVVLAEAFYYTTENGERLSKNFPVGPYVSVLMFDEDDNPVVSFETSPDDFLSIVRLANSGAGDPARALTLTVNGKAVFPTGRCGRILGLLGGVVHVFIRRSTSSCSAVHQARQTGQVGHSPARLPNEERPQELASGVRAAP